MYSFELHFESYSRNTSLTDTRRVYVSNICIVAKNNKYHQFYFSDYVTRMKGKFAPVAGSHSYPILMPRSKKVILYVENFPVEPKINSFREICDKYILPHLSIKNIQYNEIREDHQSTVSKSEL